MRVLALLEGAEPSALSGVGHQVLSALERRSFGIERLDYAPAGPARLALAAASFRRDRAAWRARFHTSRRAHRVLSRTLAKRLSASDGQHDVALQVFGWVAGQPRPCAHYVDQTRLMAERGWPQWMPFTRGERAELLMLEREMYRRAAHIFVMGAAARDSLVSDYGVAEGAITIVGGGLSFSDATPAEKLPERPRILFVGRDFERKGGECLLDAFAIVRDRLPDARLDVVGTPRRFDLPGVVGHGKISDRAELAGLYRRSRAFCLPSLYEPYGLVLIEAMAHGVPCVGSRVQAIPEILDHGGAGLLVPPGDPGALADALLAVLTDERLASEIGAAGRARAISELTWDRVAELIAPRLAELAG